MAKTTSGVSRATADLLYDSFYSGAIGGSAVALFFLLIDAIEGRPFFTPSLMGSALFGGSAAGLPSEVRLDMVAYYTPVHIVSFAVVGTLVAFLIHALDLHSKHPIQALIPCFLVLEIGFFIAAYLFIPGVIEELGAFRVAAANLIAAAAMIAFLMREHLETWRRREAEQEQD